MLIIKLRAFLFHALHKIFNRVISIISYYTSSTRSISCRKSKVEKVEKVEYIRVWRKKEKKKEKFFFFLNKLFATDIVTLFSFCFHVIMYAPK